jgi:hypothetical protein
LHSAVENPAAGVLCGFSGIPDHRRAIRENNAQYRTINSKARALTDNMFKMRALGIYRKEANEIIALKLFRPLTR